jgi:ankyrin repeat protein
LHIACLDEEDDIVSLLLEQGAEVNAKDSLGETPLHYARSPAVALKLIQKGADVGLQDALVSAIDC